jgi:hypothetical protein
MLREKNRLSPNELAEELSPHLPYDIAKLSENARKAKMAELTASNKLLAIVLRLIEKHDALEKKVNEILRA